jgi:hypothetical protein
LWSEGATFQIGRGGQASLQPNNNTGVFVMDGPNTTMNLSTAPQISRGGGNGTMIVQNGGTLNIAGANNVQDESEASGNSHGAFRVYGGSANIGDSTHQGGIWLNKAGAISGSTSEFTQTGGVVNTWGGILIGASSGTFNTNTTSSVTNSGGFLYIGNVGSIGISFGTGGRPGTNNFVISGGTIGCLPSQSWLSAVPMTLAT